MALKAHFALLAFIVCTSYTSMYPSWISVHTSQRPLQSSQIPLWVRTSQRSVCTSRLSLSPSKIIYQCALLEYWCVVLKTSIQFARIHTSSLIKTEKTLNRPITKFYNSDDVNVIAAELRLAKTRPTSFNKKHNLLLETMPTDVNRVLKTKY